VTGTQNGTVSIWELGPQRRDGNLGIVRVSTFKTEGPVRSLGVNPDGLDLVVHGGSTVSVWRIGQEAVTFAERDARDVAFIAAGQLSMLSGSTRVVADANRGIVVRREKVASAARARTGAAATSHDGRLVASRQGARDIEVKDTGSGSVMSHFSAGVDLSSILLSPDGRWLIAEETADKISVWEAATGRRVVEPFAYFDDYKVQFSPNGEVLAANDGTKKVFIWLLPERRLVATLEHPGDSISRLEFTAGGAWLITTARVDDERRDDTVRIWRAEGWARAGFVDDSVTAARVSADGRLIAAGYKDGRVDRICKRIFSPGAAPVPP
jgi:WD40 repeat protein